VRSKIRSSQGGESHSRRDADGQRVDKRERADQLLEPVADFSRTSRKNRAAFAENPAELGLMSGCLSAVELSNGKPFCQS